MATDRTVTAPSDGSTADRAVDLAAAPSGPGADPRPPPAALGDPATQVDWRGDVALELWVEADSEPARVRLAGRLDSTTAANLAQVVRELMAEGHHEIELVTEGLRVVDASAVGALAGIERQIRAAGATLHRVGPSMGPFARTRRGVTPPTTRT